MNNCAALSDEAIEAVMQYCTNITILLFDGCPKLTGTSIQHYYTLVQHLPHYMDFSYAMHVFGKYPAISHFYTDFFQIKQLWQSTYFPVFITQV